MSIRLHHGDCLDVLATLPDASVDAVVTDPPYLLGFMGREWDTKAGHEHLDWHRGWCDQAFRVLKPGGHLLAFGGTRTWHRLACAVEDAGFEVRDSIAWLYSQGFPKSLNVSRALDGARCGCPVPYSHVPEVGTADLPDLRDGVSQGADETPRATPAGVLASVSGQAGRGSTGRDGGEHEGAQADRREVRSGQPGVEGRRDVQAAARQLHRSEVREVPAGVPGDGPSGRLHHGAPSGDGSMGGSDADALGVREPHQPQPTGQPAREPGAVPVERGSQAWGGWPVCERCSQPVIPDGLGTAAKPAFEPIVVARKPLTGTVAANVLAWGTGALNVDGCRIGTDDVLTGSGSPPLKYAGDNHRPFHDTTEPRGVNQNPAGRWPSNVVLDESQAAALDAQSGETGSWSGGDRATGEVGAGMFGKRVEGAHYGDFGGGASRFFYTAKADAGERIRLNGTAHPTVKPLALMRWLVRLVTPPGGTVLEPFAGSGTTVEACILEGLSCIAIEREADYLPLIQQRIDRRRDPVAAVRATGEDAGLFGLLEEEGA